jgi:hypothetical protein
VRIAFAVGEGVVAAVIGDPLDQRTLDGERTGHGEGHPGPGVGLERAVGEVAVEPHRHAEPAHQIEDSGNGNVQPGQSPTPGDRYRGQQGRCAAECVADGVTALLPRSWSLGMAGVVCITTGVLVWAWGADWEQRGALYCAALG